MVLRSMCVCVCACKVISPEAFRNICSVMVDSLWDHCRDLSEFRCVCVSVSLRSLFISVCVTCIYSTACVCILLVCACIIYERVCVNYVCVCVCALRTLLSSLDPSLHLLYKRGIPSQKTLISFFSCAQTVQCLYNSERRVVRAQPSESKVCVCVCVPTLASVQFTECVSHLIRVNTVYTTLSIASGSRLARLCCCFNYHLEFSFVLCRLKMRKHCI